MISQQKNMNNNWRTIALLNALASGPGTFYQLCERARVPINSGDDEWRARAVLDGLMREGQVYIDGIRFVLSARAPVAGSGQVATPHYRGTYCCAPVRIVRAAAAMACVAALAACEPAPAADYGITMSMVANGPADGGKLVLCARAK